MKKILVTAGGTATAWHISQVAKTFFPKDIELHVCDINEPVYVPSAAIAKKAYKVPLAIDKDYLKTIERIIKEEGIDIIIPLIPKEAFLFAADSDFVRRCNIKTAAPKMDTVLSLADKKNLYQTLSNLSIPTPRVFAQDEIEEDRQYLSKPRLGFGSSGVEIITGDKIEKGDCVIQEYCHDDDYDEITVEVYNGKAGLHIFARRRLETKAGVCVKMEPVDNNVFLPYIQCLVENIECPNAFNVQFLWHQGCWKLFDCNLRLGAGTALSSAIGFQLTRALLAEMTDKDIDESWFEIEKKAKAVLRVYDEIVVR